MKRRLADNAPGTLVGDDMAKLQVLKIRERNLSGRIAKAAERGTSASEVDLMRSELTEAQRVIGIIEGIIADPSKCRRNKGAVPEKTEGIKAKVGKILRTFEDRPASAGA